MNYQALLQKLNYYSSQQRWIYQHSPYFVRCAMATLYGWIQRRRRYGKYFYRILKAIEESQWFSNEELDTLQFERTKAFLTYAQLHSRFYRKLFAECDFEPGSMQSLADLRKLPIINKTVVRQNLDSIISDDLSPLRIIWSHTSGTTGQGLQFPVSLESFQRFYAFRFQTYFWAGAHSGGKWAICTGQPVAPLDCRRPPFWVHDKANNWLLMSSYHLSEANLPHYIHKLKKFKPEMLVGYPSTVYLLALTNKKMGGLVRPCTVVTSAEVLLDYQRKAIEDSFQCKMFQQYGNTEHAGYMSQCENGLLHLRAEHSYVEILDEHNQPVKPGASGRCVATAFGNYATPMVRYDVGDVATLSEKTTCPCGRGGILVETVNGRVEDYVVTPDGRLIGRLDHVFRRTPNVLMAQIVQDHVDEVRILIVRDSHYTAKDEEIIRKRARVRLPNEINIRFEYVDDIPRTNQGKFPFVVSHVEKKGLIEKAKLPLTNSSQQGPVA